MPELHLLTGAYALDALDDVERAGFERHLHDCPTCPIEVIEFRESATYLADRVAAPPPDYLKARVLAQVSRTRQLPVSSRPSLPRFSLRRSVATAAAAVLVAGTAGLGGIAWQEHRNANTQAYQTAQVLKVTTDPNRFEVVGRPSVGGSTDVTAAQGLAVFSANGLPRPKAGRAYQLWVIRKTDAGTRITSAGVLKLQGGNAQQLVSGVAQQDVVAVSVEPEGGSRQPTTTPVVQMPIV